MSQPSRICLYDKGGVLLRTKRRRLKLLLRLSDCWTLARCRW